MICITMNLITLKLQQIQKSNINNKKESEEAATADVISTESERRIKYI